MKRSIRNLLTLVLFFIMVVPVYAQVECPEVDPSNPGNRLVVIGHSTPAGWLDSNMFPRSQRWTFPSYIAARLGATYSAPELQTGLAAGGLSAPDLRSAFSPTGLVDSPYYGILDLPAVDIKARPEELHTNLAVPGARLSEILDFEFCPESRCARHVFLNGEPYSGLVNPTGASPSQVDIAVFLKPKWILVYIGGNDLRAGVEPLTFKNDFRTMLTRLTHCNSDVQIVVDDLGSMPGAPGNVTAGEADQLLGFSPGTSSLIYYQAIGVVPASDDFFRLNTFVGFVLGLQPAPPPLITVALQSIGEAYGDAYNEAIHDLTKEFGAIYLGHDEVPQNILEDALEVSIDGTAYQLTNDYGGGVWSFQGTHVGKTAHAAIANKFISKMNAKAPQAPKMPKVDLSAVACTDLHVRRAVGLPEDPAEFSCPEICLNGQDDDGDGDLDCDDSDCTDSKACRH